jgi:hypothetical protein
MYRILFGGTGLIKYDEAEAFKAAVALCSGIHALQRTTETETITLRGDEKDPITPEAIRGDWNAVADFLVTYETPVETPPETPPTE